MTNMKVSTTALGWLIMALDPNRLLEGRKRQGKVWTQSKKCVRNDEALAPNADRRAQTPLFAVN